MEERRGVQRDLAAIQQLIADDISYHDLVYEEPHEGREGVMAWLQKFVIEDITDGSQTKVGVKWHVECGDGIFFPFSRGVSFITLNDQGKIQTLLGTLTPLIRKLGPAADPANLQKLPIAAAAVWALYTGYIFTVMFSTAVPGQPVWSTPPEESINIWWINDLLTSAHLSFIQHVPSPPVSEALFNFVLAWALLFLPVIITDGPSQKVQNKAWWMTGIMFLTNVFFIPFMALRAAPELSSSTVVPATADIQDSSAGSSTSSSISSSSVRSQASTVSRKVAEPGSQQLPAWAAGVGAFGAFVGVFAIYWGLAGRPEFGDLAARADYLQATFNSNRVFWAFWLDMVFFYTFQLTLLQAAAPVYRFVPYFGLAGWLMAGGTKTQQANFVDLAGSSRSSRSVAQAAVSEKEKVLQEPKWPDKWPFRPEDFLRYDESDDSVFYDSPRFVYHIDDGAVKALTEFYAEHFPPSGQDNIAILDICSSWISHYPPGYKAGKIVALGMNEQELSANKQVTEYVVHDLNLEPALPFADNSFDVITNAVSVDYLNKPLEVFQELHRVLKPGGRAYMSFSNRCFPTKAIALWTATGDDDHIWIVGSYFHYSVPGGFTQPQCSDISPRGGLFGKGDPMYVVYAQKNEA
eukprot:gene9058-9229_t